MAQDPDAIFAKILKGMPDLLGIPHRSRFILILLITGAVVYYFAIHRRRQ